MELSQIILLGMIQGIFEWLPVSSEGMNSMIMMGLYDISLIDAVYFSIWLHLGTLLAALVYFRVDIKNMIINLPNYFKNVTNKEGYSGLTNFLIISTFISGALGGGLILLIEQFNFQYFMVLIGVMLIITGIFQKVAKRSHVNKEIRVRDSILAGIFQGFSALPGLSRSGLTTSILLIRKYDAKVALRISFLMSIPFVLGANIGLLLFDKISFSWIYLVGIGVSFLIGLATISGLVKLAGKINFWLFCIFGGLLSIAGSFI